MATEPNNEDFVKADQSDEENENDCAMNDAEETEPLEDKDDGGQTESIEVKRNSIESTRSDDIIPSDTSSLPGKIADYFLSSFNFYSISRQILM